MEFNIDDRVIVTYKTSKYFGHTGTVKSTSCPKSWVSAIYEVLLDGNVKTLAFSENELALHNSLLNSPPRK
jgi:hypothetical protein